MGLNITVLVMSHSKKHNAAHPAARHSRYDLVDVYPQGQIQPQPHTFYTIDVSGTPFDNCQEARDFILEPVYEDAPAILVGTDDFAPEILHRHKYVLNQSRMTGADLASLRDTRRLAVSWTRFAKLFEAVV